MSLQPAIRGGALIYGPDSEVVEALNIDADGEWRLMWTFDPDATPAKRLLAKLTEEEARAIFERNRAVEGTLEPVRATLAHRAAAVIAFDADATDDLERTIRVALTEIPADRTEDEFLDLIDNLPLMTEAEHAREAEAKIAALKRELAELQRRRRKLVWHARLRVSWQITKQIWSRRRELEATTEDAQHTATEFSNVVAWT